MRNDFDKIMLIINHSSNERKHLSSIYRVIENFQVKWSTQSSMLMDDMVFQMYSAMEMLLTKLKVDDTE